MRKQALLVAIVALVAFSFTSCKKDAKEEVKTEEGTNESAKELADNTLYQCPMNCEKGKSYTEEGKCPVCKMDLKAKKVDMDAGEDRQNDGDEGEGHDSDEHDSDE